MQVPLEITFRNLDKVATVEDMIRDKAAKLEQVCDDIISCRVLIEKPQEHMRSGNAFGITVDFRIPPNHDIVVKRKSSGGNVHDVLPTMVRDVFDVSERKLKKVAERRGGNVKRHPRQETQAFVERLFASEGYGFIRSLDGRDIYFHENSVLNHEFGRMAVGTGVRYVEETGENGPQASTVQIVDQPLRT